MKVFFQNKEDLLAVGRDGKPAGITTKGVPLVGIGLPVPFPWNDSPDILPIGGHGIEPGGILGGVLVRVGNVEDDAALIRQPLPLGHVGQPTGKVVFQQVLRADGTGQG